PKKAVGTVTGIGAAAGGLGGVLVQLLAGYLDGTFSTNKAYTIMFSVCAFAYLIAWALMKVLVPKYNPINDL
ncbi:MAG: MFS transporter, partial [Bacteroidota bacterium]|nr:MFS transporter [Bacteroidota bacterium]